MPTRVPSIPWRRPQRLLRGPRARRDGRQRLSGNAVPGRRVLPGGRVDSDDPPQGQDGEATRWWRSISSSRAPLKLTSQSLLDSGAFTNTAKWKPHRRCCGPDRVHDSGGGDGPKTANRPMARSSGSEWSRINGAVQTGGVRIPRVQRCPLGIKRFRRPRPARQDTSVNRTEGGGIVKDARDNPGPNPPRFRPKPRSLPLPSLQACHASRQPLPGPLIKPAPDSRQSDPDRMDETLRPFEGETSCGKDEPTRRNEPPQEPAHRREPLTVAG